MYSDGAPDFLSPCLWPTLSNSCVDFVWLISLLCVDEFSKFFYRNKHIMIDLGTGNNNKVCSCLLSIIQDPEPVTDLTSTHVFIDQLGYGWQARGGFWTPFLQKFTWNSCIPHILYLSSSTSSRLYTVGPVKGEVWSSAPKVCFYAHISSNCLTSHMQHILDWHTILTSASILMSDYSTRYKYCKHVFFYDKNTAKDVNIVLTNIFISPRILHHNIRGNRIMFFRTRFHLFVHQKTGYTSCKESCVGIDIKPSFKLGVL